MKEESNPTYL